MHSTLGYSILSTLCMLAGATPENWPQWRGPQGAGIAPVRQYPIQWSQSENIAWKVPMSRPSGSTPAIWDDSIYITTAENESNVLHCLDRAGKEKWKVTLGKERAGKHKKGSGSNPSPVTDGKLVFIYFKSGDLACADNSGKLIWHKNLQQEYGQDTLWHDLGTSPVITKNYVVIACMQTGPSYLVAYEKATGKLAWKQDRMLDAPEEAAQSYSTPVVISEGDKETIIVLGADHVTAHEAATGKEIWRVGGLNPTGHKYFRSIASPVVTDGMVLAPYARGETLTAIRLGGKGDVTSTHVVWTKKGTAADVPTPAAGNGKAYVCTDKGEVICLRVQSGDVLWRHQLERNRNAYSSSPIVANGHIYVTREDGTTFVLKDGSEPTVVATNELGEFTVSTPAFSRGQILIRTSEHLYCIGKPSSLSAN